MAKGSLFASPLESQVDVRTGSKTGSGLSNLGGAATQPIDFVVRPVGIEPTTLSLEETSSMSGTNEDQYGLVIQYARNVAGFRPVPCQAYGN